MSKSTHTQNVASSNYLSDKNIVNHQSNDFGIYKKWMIWSLAALFYLYETILRVSPSVMTNSLMEDFGVTSTTLGFLTSCYYFAYVPLQIPCGLIVDRLGIRFILSLSCLLCISGTLMFGISEKLIYVQIGRFIVGAGSACAFISCLKLTIEWFNPTQFVLVAGLTNMMGTLGGLFAGTPLALFVNALGWRQASIYLGLAGIPVILLILLFIKNRPDNKTISNSSIKEDRLTKSFPQLLKNKHIWIAGIVGGFMYLPITAFAELWGVPFFMQIYQIDNSIASSISHMVFIGMALGSPFAAWFLTKVKSITKVMQISSLIACALFVLIAYSNYYDVSFAYIVVFFAGFCIGGQVLCFTIAKNHSSENINGTAIGFTNALVMMSGIIFQPFLGHILDVFWEGNLTAAGIRDYSTNAYQMSMLTIPLCFIVSYIMLKFVTDKPSTLK